jgi:hypothetical protein
VLWWWNIKKHLCGSSGQTPTANINLLYSITKKKLGVSQNNLDNHDLANDNGDLINVDLASVRQKTRFFFNQPCAAKIAQ